MKNSAIPEMKSQKRYIKIKIDDQSKSKKLKLKNFQEKSGIQVLQIGIKSDGFYDWIANFCVSKYVKRIITKSTVFVSLELFVVYQFRNVCHLFMQGNTRGNKRWLT